MSVTLLEYLLVRMAFGLTVVAFRAAGLAVSAVLGLLATTLRIAVRPLAHVLAQALGRVVGHVRLAAARRSRARVAAPSGYR